MAEGAVPHTAALVAHAHFPGGQSALGAQCRGSVLVVAFRDVVTATPQQVARTLQCKRPVGNEEEEEEEEEEEKEEKEEEV